MGDARVADGVEIRSMVPTLESVKVAAGPSATVDRVRLALEEREYRVAGRFGNRCTFKPSSAGTKIYGGRDGERLFVEGLCLPSGAGLEERDVSRVCEINDEGFWNRRASEFVCGPELWFN
jgi:hypothetical protein